MQHLKVLRLRPDEHFICVYQNRFYECNFVKPNFAQIIKELPENHEPITKVVLALGVLEPRSWELALQKATELGVSEIIPFTSQYTSKNTDFIARHHDRHLTIIESAAEQSFRNTAPQLSSLKSLSEVVTLNIPLKILAHESAAAPLTKYDESPVLVIVGPEGGFSEPEVTFAKANNCRVVSLGRRILRAETAALYLLSKLL